LKSGGQRNKRAQALKNALLLQPNGLMRRLYGKALWNFSRKENTIYLTFDDGPVPGLTEWVLDELRRVDAKATFFCVGENILNHRGVFDRIKKEGHTVANHTMTHIRGFKSSVSNYIREAEECRDLVQNNLFRPPYGQLKRSQYKALLDLGYRIILWDVISYDYEQISEKRVAANVLKNTKNGSVVLFHDNIKAENNLKYALPVFLRHFSQRGFSFKAL
jgi:peptidoglycan/xylan/chitin deacetylase (PgdA/CDA1 family)